VHCERCGNSCLSSLIPGADRFSFIIVENTFALVLPSTAGDQTSLQQILALGLRSDSVRVKSEGTRVLVNVIKSLWGSEPPSTPAATTLINSTLEERQRKRAEAKREVIVPACAEALARLIGRSGKYPILVNEGVVALSLLSMQKQGGWFCPPLRCCHYLITVGDSTACG
jgi:hypothetical protein